MVGGPVGSAADIVGAGAAMDGIITGVDSGVHHKYKPYGEVASVSMVNGKSKIGDYFDFTAGIGLDALAGLSEGIWKVVLEQDYKKVVQHVFIV